MNKLALSLLFFGMPLSAQAPVKDAPGCQDSQVLSRLTGCRIVYCKNGQFDAADLPTAKTGTQRRTHLEGAKEFIRYSCGADVSGLQIARDSESALKSAGFKIVFTDSYQNLTYYLTAQKGAQWVHVQSTPKTYELTTVKVKELERSMQANAEGWAEQINQSGKVSIYGINFDTGKATIRPDSEPVLNEVAAMLQKQSTWYMLIAGHTDTAGSDAINIPLSRQRAESVITWLAAKGIDKSRLAPAGFGSRVPLADNATEDGRGKNRRVDLVKLY